MNNAMLIDDEAEESKDLKPLLRQRETELVNVIAAIEKVASSSDWQTLKELIFDGLVESLEKRLQSEASRSELNAPEIYRLNGQLAWAKRFVDFNKLSAAYRLELTNVRKKLNAKND